MFHPDGVKIVISKIKIYGSLLHICPRNSSLHCFQHYVYEQHAQGTIQKALSWEVVEGHKIAYFCL